MFYPWPWPQSQWCNARCTQPSQPTAPGKSFDLENVLTYAEQIPTKAYMWPWALKMFHRHWFEQWWLQTPPHCSSWWRGSFCVHCRGPGFLPSWECEINGKMLWWQVEERRIAISVTLLLAHRLCSGRSSVSLLYHLTVASSSTVSTSNSARISSCITVLIGRPELKR